MSSHKAKVSWSKRLSSKLKRHPIDSKADAPVASKQTVKEFHDDAIVPQSMTRDDPAHASIPELEPRQGDSRPTAIKSSRSDIKLQATAEVEGSEDPLQNAVPPTSLSFWVRGYIKKRTESPDLLLAYEALIAEDIAGNDKPKPNPASVVAGISNKLRNNGPAVAVRSSPGGMGEYFIATPGQVVAFIDSRMKIIEDKSWKLPFSQKTVDYQKQVQRVVRGVLYVKDSIGPLMSSDPHASIAWAGVCLMLPLLCNPAEQKEMLVDGLETIVSMLCRLTVSEQLYREAFVSQTGKVSEDVRQLMLRFEWESVGMLADIIEYQARVACHTYRGILEQYVRDVFRVDDWKQILERITKADDSCSKLLSSLNEQKHDHRHQQLEAALNRLNKQAADLTDVHQIMLKEIEQGFQKLHDDMSELQVQNILEALDVSNYEKHKRVIPQRVEGTCKWFTEHHQYRSWKAAKSDVLWLAADPGCGKSVLTKHLIDDELCSNEDRTTCYFFFKDGLTQQQGLERALCALLHQLFTHKRILTRHALKSLVSAGKQFARSADKLWSILLQACSDPSAGEIVLFLDALDECEIEDRRDLVRRVSRLYMSSENKFKGRIKILMTSRPYHNINVSFQELADKLPHVHLSADQETAAIRDEINVVVDYRVTMLARSLKLDSNTTAELKEKLKATQNRTYLWLRLIFEALEAGKGRLERDRAQLVHSVPATVQEAYAAILQKCTNVSKARKIFEIMLAAQTPLRVKELNVATSLSESAEKSSDDDSPIDHLQLDEDEVFQEDMRQACGLFVSVIDGKVYFIHQTAREFLSMENVSRQKLETPINLPLSTVACHREMAIACTQYIAMQAHSKNKASRATSFLQYATQFWDLHVAMALIACKAEIFDDLYDRVFEVCECRDFWWQYGSNKAGSEFDGGEIDDQRPEYEPRRIWSNESTFFYESPPEGLAPGVWNKGYDHGSGRTEQTSDLITLSMFGLIGVVWLTCAQLQTPRLHRGRQRSVQQQKHPKLQWLVSGEAQRPDIGISLSEDHAMVNVDTKGSAGKQSYQVFWEKEHFSDLTAREQTEMSSANQTGPFKIAQSESEEVLKLLEHPADYRLDVSASQTAVLQIFTANKASPNTMHKFQQLLQRASAGGHLHEFSFTFDERLKHGI